MTSHDFLMRDAARLKSVRWHYIIIDEGHRLKNAKCKLNNELRAYSAAHRLLLTGCPLATIHMQYDSARTAVQGTFSGSQVAFFHDSHSHPQQSG